MKCFFKETKPHRFSEGSTLVSSVDCKSLATSSLLKCRTPPARWNARGLLLNPEGACLFVGVAFLHDEGDAFEPEAEGFPVDEEDDFEGDEGKGEGEAGEVGVGEFCPLAGEGADEVFLVAFVIVDRDVEVLNGIFEAKVKREVERGEGGDVVIFRHSDVEAVAGIVERDEVGLEFAEGIADLNDGCERAVFRVEAEENRDRVEGVAQHARECEEADAGGTRGDALRLEKGLKIRAEAA